MNQSTFTKPFALLAALLTSALSLYAGDDKGIPAVVQGGDDPNVGIKYKGNQGLFVTDISAKIIGLKMADVEEKPVSKEVRLTAQIYDTAATGTAFASAWIPAAAASGLKIDAVVSGPEKRSGRVTGVSMLTVPMNQKAEVLLEIDDPGDGLKLGQFLEFRAALPADGDSVVVPKQAVLKTSEGTFAYVDNSGWKMRTAITTGTEHDGLVEITDGLFSGDSVVTAPVMTLWMTELQLTKSGKACSCGH